MYDSASSHFLEGEGRDTLHQATAPAAHASAPLGTTSSRTTRVNPGQALSQPQTQLQPGGVSVYPGLVQYHSHIDQHFHLLLRWGIILSFVL